MAIHPRKGYGLGFVAGLLLAAGVAVGSTTVVAQTAPAAQPAPVAAAQPVAASDLAFDVATVKPSSLDLTKIGAMAQAGHMPRLGPHVEGLRAEYNVMSLK